VTHRLSVLGTGYLGATHAVCMAELGFEVIGMDVDAAKIDKLKNGEVPFFEPGLEPLLRKNIENGRLRFTTSYEEAGRFADVHFICVGTPQKKGEYAADMTYVNAVTHGILPYAKDGDLFVGKSTVPVGTAERLTAEIKAGAPQGVNVELCWNPEFLREGFAVEDTLTPDRMVFGVGSERAERILREVFAPVIEIPTPVVITDLATAQLVKVAANAFLATKISFINAMAEVCETVHGDVKKLSEALSHDTRIGGRFLHAGLGFGGGCLPKDIRAFMARAGELGVDQALSFLKEVDAINLRRRARMIDLTRESLGDQGFKGAKVAIFGAAFKPNSDDIRDSPALDVAASIQRSGADVHLYDPAAMENVALRHPEIKLAESAVEAATGADIVCHLTEWREFRDMEPSLLDNVVAHKRIVDGRNALDPDRWRGAGWTYRALGRP
jgi:UDPglucose 6-dehydrogenase